MAEVDTITVLDSNGVEREVPTLLSVETLLSTLLGTIDGRVDGLEALLTTQAGYLDGVEAKLDTMIAAIVPVGGAGKAAAVPVTVANDDTIVPTAVAHGANPSAVAAAAQANPKTNRAGIPFVIGGHPNIITRSNRILDSDGAQTDAALIPVISAGTKIVITQMWIKADKNNSGNVAVKIGFGTANVPTPALAGVDGLIFDEDLGAGEGHQIGNASGIVAVGADGADLRITCDDPAGGALYVGYSYYTIES